MQSGVGNQPVIMQRLYLEITTLGNVESAMFVKLAGVPAKRCNLLGSLRVLDSECNRISVTVEGPVDDVREYYSYMSLIDNVFGQVTKVEEDDIERYTQTEAFHVDNYEDESSDEDERGDESAVPDEEDGEHVEPVGVHAERDVRVIPETPEKDEKSESESSPERDEFSQETAEEDIETQYIDPARSPVFKGGRPLTRREPVGYQGTVELFESDEEESQSILQTNRRKRLCKE